MPVHAFVDESARNSRYLIAAAIVDPAHVSRLRKTMSHLLCMTRLVGDLLDRRAQRLVIDTRSNKDVHDKRTLRRLLAPHPAESALVYEHLDSVSEPLLWIADVVAWCWGAGQEWRKRVDPITTAAIDLD